MAEALSTIRNIGPALESAFQRAGINDAETLRDIGADAGYLKLLNSGVRPHFIGYYVIVMGLQGRPWNDCQGQEKRDLRDRFDALKAQSVPNGDAAKTELEKILDRIGVVEKKNGRKKKLSPKFKA
ncbi:competence protein TfoX [Rhodobacteraceae bacterium Araon29]|tara:strand:+ start:3668 stop:4045 length:378 start_codon:yes stop_codon:yes gene_type:complete